MQLKRRRDSEFPSEKVYRRFGARTQLARKVLEYCGGQPDPKDAAELCGPIAKQAVSTPENDETGDEAQFGFVYLIKSGRYKVGRSNAAGRREREIALQLPDKADTVHVIRTDDPPGIEAYWHRRFATQRRNGEWFELSAADVKAFKRRKFM